MLAIIKEAVRALLASKKAVMAVLGVAVWLGGKIGLHFSSAEAFELISPIIAYLLAQGLADHGKEAAKVANAKPV